VSALPPPRRAVRQALMVVAPVLWSLAGVLTRQIQTAGAFEMAFWRSGFAAAFVFLALLFLQAKRPWHTLRAAGVPGLVSGAMWAVMFTCFIVALTRNRSTAGFRPSSGCLSGWPRRCAPCPGSRRVREICRCRSP